MSPANERTVAMSTNSKQDTVVNTWTANGIEWRELRVWVGNGFRYFVQREIQPGIWG